MTLRPTEGFLLLTATMIFWEKNREISPLPQAFSNISISNPQFSPVSPPVQKLISQFSTLKLIAVTFSPPLDYPRAIDVPFASRFRISPPSRFPDD